MAKDSISHRGYRARERLETEADIPTDRPAVLRSLFAVLVFTFASLSIVCVPTAAKEEVPSFVARGMPGASSQSNGATCRLVERRAEHLRDHGAQPEPAAHCFSATSGRRESGSRTDSTSRTPPKAPWTDSRTGAGAGSGTAISIAATNG